MSLFVLQRSGSQCPARKAAQPQPRPRARALQQLGSPAPGPGPPAFPAGAEQWVELVGVLAPQLLLPQPKVLPARASPDPRVRIQKVPQMLVFGSAATALKVGVGAGEQGRAARGCGRGPRAPDPTSPPQRPPAPVWLCAPPSPGTWGGEWDLDGQ